MSEPEFIEIDVNVPPWSESEKSWHLLTKKGITLGSWTRGLWFPKSVCNLNRERGVLRLPLWLYNKKFEHERPPINEPRQF
jgi:hypothetical protein